MFPRFFSRKLENSPGIVAMPQVVSAQRPTPGDYDHQNRTSPVVVLRRALRAHVVYTSDLGPEHTNDTTAPTRIIEAYPVTFAR